MERREVRHLLREAGIHPSKRLGQNFLVDAGVVGAIAEAISRRSPEVVVEIGPGLGSVTDRLVEGAVPIIAVELDRRLAKRLGERLAGRDNVRIETADILRFDLASAIDGRRAYVFGSLPYRSTAPILRYLIEQRASIEGALLITQREVAEKLTASPGKDGTALGVLVRAYAEVDVLRQIGRGSFEPSPEVESTLWEMRFLEAPRFTCDTETFFETARTLYGARRKMLRKALQQLVARGAVEHVLAEAGIAGDVRGETLTFDELDRLAEAVAAVRSAEGDV